MKNIFKIIVLFVCAAGFLTSCDKESEGVSEVTTYPVITLTGGNFYLMKAGTQPFVDPGVSAMLNGKPVPVTTTGSVDATTTGLYFLNYTVLDEKGLFPITVDRKVLVVDNLPLQDDFEGTYVYATNSSRVRKVTKPAGEQGWYRISDIWWQEVPVPVEFVDFGGRLAVLPGKSPYGKHIGTVEYDPATKILKFDMIFLDQNNYRTILSWKKQ